MTVSVRLALGMSLVFGLAVAVTACTTNPPSLQPTVASASPSPSPTSATSTSPTARPSFQPSTNDAGPSASPTVLPSPLPTSVAMPDLTALPPVGDLLVSTRGMGAGAVALSALAERSKITVRFACSGNNSARLADDSDALVMGVSACDGTTVYATSFTGTASDRVLRIQVEPGVSWVVAVWSS
jgi:hypothetical protein